MCQPTADGTCPDNISHKIKSDEQEIEIISGESSYWEQFEEEVRYNSKRNDIEISPPTISCEPNNQPPGELSCTEENNSCDSLLAGQGGEYIEEEFKNPVLSTHEVDVPLDLSAGPELQPNNPDRPGDYPAGPD